MSDYLSARSGFINGYNQAIADAGFTASDMYEAWKHGAIETPLMNGLTFDEWLTKYKQEHRK